MTGLRLAYFFKSEKTPPYWLYMGISAKTLFKYLIDTWKYTHILAQGWGTDRPWVGPLNLALFYLTWARALFKSE